MLLTDIYKPSEKMPEVGDRVFLKCEYWKALNVSGWVVGYLCYTGVFKLDTVLISLKDWQVSPSQVKAWMPVPNID